MSKRPRRGPGSAEAERAAAAAKGPAIPLPETPEEARALCRDLWADPEKWIGLLWPRMPAPIGHGQDGAARMEPKPLELWSRQLDLIRAVRDHRFTVCRSGHGTGKTTSLALLCVLWMLSRPGATCVTTGSSHRVLQKILWPRIRELLALAAFPLGAPALHVEWRPDDSLPSWAAVAVAADDPNSFAGFHNPAGVLVLIDEADGLSPEIFDSAVACAQGEGDRLVAVGNPHTPGSAFDKRFRSPGWSRVHISCLEHPNVVSGQELFPGMVTAGWVERMRADVGEGSPAWQSRVLGVCPDVDQDALLPLPWWEAALKRDIPAAFEGPLVMAVDVARAEGGDRTVFAIRDDLALRSLDIRSGIDAMATVGLVAAACEQWKAKGRPLERVVIDDVGVGGGVVDRLFEIWPRLQALGAVELLAFNGGERPLDSHRFANARAEAFWRLREALDPTASPAFAVDPRMGEPCLELTSIKLKPHSSGKIALMPKEEMIAKGILQRSPDCADALSMAFSPKRALKPAARSAPPIDFASLGVGGW